MNVKLKSAMLSMGARQFEIAAATGVHETRLSRIVQERVSPTKEERDALARYLGASPEELFDDDVVEKEGP